MKRGVLSVLRLSDRYERKARFLPGLVSTLPLAPSIATFELIAESLVEEALLGVGCWSALGILLANIASLFGNRYQQDLWPRWPNDAPTHVLLHPKASTASRQQREQWYEAIASLTGLDLNRKRVGDAEIEAVINDAVRQLRLLIRPTPWHEHVQLQNTDYAWARNMAGLWPVWVLTSVVSAAYCWGQWSGGGVGLAAPVLSSAVLVIAGIAYRVFPGYVRRRAAAYADALLSATTALHRERSSGPAAVGQL